MNLTEKIISAGPERWKTKAIHQRVLARVLGLILGLTPIHVVIGNQPLSVCALPSVSTNGNILLLDPVTHVSIAFLSDPNGRLADRSQPVILQTVGPNDIGATLPTLKLVDALPEFWAQPASFSPFLKGPGAYSGQGTEIRAQDWAGMQATDRRAYRLDPGLKLTPVIAYSVPREAVRLTVKRVADSLLVEWAGVAGRTYQLQFATSVNGPFALVQTFNAAQDGAIQTNISPNGTQGFYRVADISP